MNHKSKRRATIYDVASEAGVSITTVSRFLNNSHTVKSATANRIASSMENLDYIPQGNAGSRAMRTFGRIGVLTPFFPAPSFVQRLEGMIPVLRENNFEVVIYTIETPEQLDEYLTSVPFTRRIDGLILMSMLLTAEHHRTLEASGLHVVMVESDDKNYSRVLADDYQGGRMAAELFLSKDYFPCAYFGDKNRDISYSLYPSDVRLRGFNETLEAGGRDPQDTIILESSISVENASQVFDSFLDSQDPPRGIFAMSDLQAVGVIKTARRRGIRIPEDMAVLGFDDMEAADWMDLSTISQHLGDSGRVAAGLLLDKISNRSEAIQKVNLQVVLVERRTT